MAALVAPKPAKPANSAPPAPAPGPTCEERIATARATPALPGAPDLEAQRAHVLLYAKAEPVVFLRTPEADAHAAKSARVYRSQFERTSYPYSILKGVWSALTIKPELGRSVLLREGYLYADKPAQAFALVDLVSPQQLFSDATIWIQRGEKLFHAERSRAGHYVFSDGPEKGQRVKLVLFDRIGTGQPPEPLHRDFASLKRRLGFDRVKLTHLGEREIVADLRYGSAWVPTLLRSDGARLELECELETDQNRAILAQARAENARRERVLSVLRRAMVAQVDEKLPFDEPLTEYGQQDGQLRRRWLTAYLAGKSSFEFQDDLYYVFNQSGAPLVPQVCVDFVFDTFERASGTWWRPRGEKPERVIGKLDLHTLSDETRRRGTGFVDFATSNPDDFEVELLPDKERVPFKFGGDLAEYLVKEGDRFRAGDVVLIKGYAPWDKPWRPKVMHVHSFFIFDNDPITGFPTLLAGNPGRPLLQTWQFEAFRTPDRSIWYRVRPHLSWLERIVAVDDGGKPSG
jgi:hypothetical protein